MLNSLYWGLFVSGEKTEEPTEAKKREARLKGQVLKSQELLSALTLTVSFAVILSAVPTIWEMSMELMKQALGGLYLARSPLNALRETTGSLLLIMVKALLPAMILAMMAGLVFNFLTVGVGFSPKALNPELSKLNPLNGIKRWFSKKTAMEGVKLLIKTACMFWVFWDFWQEHQHSLLGVTRTKLSYFGAELVSLADLAWRLLGVQIAFGVLDFALQYYEHRKSLKMSKQEVKDEYKKQEGDPMFKAQRRARARKMIQNSGMQNLEKASVVITNPTHLAIALEYNMKMQAPVVVSRGADQIALEIRRRAASLGIPLVEDKPLARALFKLDIGHSIPPDLFKAVAEILLTVREAEDYLD